MSASSFRSSSNCAWTLALLVFESTTCCSRDSRRSGGFGLVIDNQIKARITGKRHDPMFGIRHLLDFLIGRRSNVVHDLLANENIRVQRVGGARSLRRSDCGRGNLTETGPCTHQEAAAAVAPCDHAFQRFIVEADGARFERNRSRIGEPMNGREMEPHETLCIRLFQRSENAAAGRNQQRMVFVFVVVFHGCDCRKRNGRTDRGFEPGHQARARDQRIEFLRLERKGRLIRSWLKLRAFRAGGILRDMADEDQRRRIERVLLRRRCGWRCRSARRRGRWRRNFAQRIVFIRSSSRLFRRTRSGLCSVGRRADIGGGNRIVGRRLLLVRMRLESRREGFLCRSLAAAASWELPALAASERAPT